MADRNTIVLAVLATLLVAYLLQQRNKKPVAVLGSSKRSRTGLSSAFCKNVPIDSPDFQRCALGSGRSVLPGNPKKTMNNLNTKFVSNEYSSSLGNPFAVNPSAAFVNKDYLGSTARPVSKVGSQAFPFTQAGSGPGAEMVLEKSGATTGFRPTPRSDESGVKFAQPSTISKTFVEAPPRGSSRPSVTAPSEGVKFSSAFLGAAVSPSSHDALGASPEEIAQAAHQLENVNSVSKNSGGQLNLLIHNR